MPAHEAAAAQVGAVVGKSPGNKPARGGLAQAASSRSQPGMRNLACDARQSASVLGSNVGAVSQPSRSGCGSLDDTSPAALTGKGPERKAFWPCESISPTAQ